MMLSKDAIADVVEVLRPDDFYYPANQLVYDSVLDLYARGEPADAVTVSAELTRAGQLSRAGGAPYLHTLISMVPTAANAGYYAQIVAERATLRRLVVAGTRIVQMGYDTASGSADVVGSVDDVVDRAQAEVYDVTERRLSEDYIHIESLLQPTLDEIEKISATGGIGAGIPTGFAKLDEITNGLHPGQMITVAGRPGSGKALALNTPLATPTGWTTMGEVRVGEQLLGADGRPTRVVAATGVMTGRPCYEVEFSDGSVITADADHQWRTRTRAARRAAAPTPRRMPQPSVVQRVEALAAWCATRPDRTVSIRQLVGILGADLAPVIQLEAWRIGALRREHRPYARGSAPYSWRTPVYSQQALARAVHQRVCVPAIVAPPQPHIVTTAQLAVTLRCPTADHRLNHSIDCTAPLDLPDRDLPVPPYVLGAWLGDGSSDSATLTSADSQVVEQIRATGVDAPATGAPMRYRLRLPQPTASTRSCAVCGKPFRPALPQVRTCGKSCGAKARRLPTPVAKPTCPDCGREVFGWRRCAECHSRRGTVQARLRELGVLGDKHIPAMYLRASEAQRRALLAGLLDTDGYATKSGSVEFSVTRRRLA